MLITMLYVYKCLIAFYLKKKKRLISIAYGARSYLTIVSAAFCCVQGWGSTKSSLSGLHYWLMLSLLYHNDDNIKAEVC